MIIQELVSLGSLLNYLIENASKINSNFELKIWASQIACGKLIDCIAITVTPNNLSQHISQYFYRNELPRITIICASRFSRP